MCVCAEIFQLSLKCFSFTGNSPAQLPSEPKPSCMAKPADTNLDVKVSKDCD